MKLKKEFHHRDTETHRPDCYDVLSFSVSLCLCGGGF